MSDVKNAIQKIVSDELTKLNNVGAVNRIGYVSQVNGDNSCIVLVDGYGVTCTTVYAMIVGMQALVMTDGQGNASAVPTQPIPAPTVFEKPPYFTGNVLRFGTVATGVPQGKITGLILASFQDAFNSNVYVLVDKDFGPAGLNNYQVVGLVLSQNGIYCAIWFQDNNNLNIIMQVWRLGSFLGKGDPVNPPGTNLIFFLKGMLKVTQFIIPMNGPNVDLGQYPIQGRYLPNFLQADSGVIVFDSNPTHPTFGQFVLATSPSATSVIAWLPGWPVGSEPDLQAFPDNTFANTQFKAFGVILNNVLDSGKYCNLNDAVNDVTQNLPAYHASGSLQTNAFGIIDFRVDNSGTVYWLQQKLFIAATDTTAPFVGINFNIPNTTLAQAQGSGYYMYRFPVGGPQIQMGFWPDALIDTPRDTASVTWGVFSGPTAIQNLGTLFFLPTRDYSITYQPVQIYDYLVKPPTIVVKIPTNPVVVSGVTNFPNNVSKVNILGSYHYAIIGPFTGTTPSKQVTFTATNYSMASGQCSYTYPQQTIQPLIKGSLLIGPPSSQGFISETIRTKQFFSFVYGNGPNDQIFVLRGIPASNTIVELKVSNLKADFFPASPPNTTAIFILDNKTDKAGFFMDAVQHLFKENVSNDQPKPILSFDTGKKLKVSPGQLDETAIRITHITGVASG